MGKFKNEIELIHPNTSQHHLRLCGGFQFSSHKSDDEWREYGLNHFVLPKVLISIEGDRTFITYTTERQDFNIETFKEVVSYFENTEVNETEDSLEMLHVWKTSTKTIGENLLKKDRNN